MDANYKQPIGHTIVADIPKRKVFAYKRFSKEGK